MRVDNRRKRRTDLRVREFKSIIQVYRDGLATHKCRADWILWGGQERHLGQGDTVPTCTEGLHETCTQNSEEAVKKHTSQNLPEFARVQNFPQWWRRSVSVLVNKAPTSWRCLLHIWNVANLSRCWMLDFFSLNVYSHTAGGHWTGQWAVQFHKKGSGPAQGRHLNQLSEELRLQQTTE